MARRQGKREKTIRFDILIYTTPVSLSWEVDRLKGFSNQIKLGSLDRRLDPLDRKKTMLLVVCDTPVRLDIRFSGTFFSILLWSTCL